MLLLLLRKAIKRTMLQSCKVSRLSQLGTLGCRWTITMILAYRANTIVKQIHCNAVNQNKTKKYLIECYLFHNYVLLFTHSLGVAIIVILVIT